MERLYKGSSGDDFMEFYKREMGFSKPRNFSRRISASEAMVKRLDLYGKLTGHEGCVNTIDFNATGDVLVSGSDDRKVILWDWATTTSKFSYQSGHMDNIFQTKFMPFTDDRKIITASADGQVRLGLVLENGRVETKKVGKHQGRVHKLAVEPGSPYILYSCGEDGFVQHIMEANRRGREDHSRVTLTPDMIMHVLRMHRRQALAYIERRENLGDIDSDDDDDGGGGGAYILGFSDGEEGENSECSIS